MQRGKRLIKVEHCVRERTRVSNGKAIDTIANRVGITRIRGSTKSDWGFRLGLMSRGGEESNQ